MKTNCNTYIGEFVNLETTRPLNTEIQQLLTIRIVDLQQEPGGYSGEFNVRFVESLNPDGTLCVWFLWQNMPADVLAVKLGYYSGGWVDTTATDTKGPFSIQIPNGDYRYSFVITSIVGTIRYELYTNAAVSRPLELADVPCEIEVVDSDEDKFTPLRSKRLTMQLHTSGEVNISTFAPGGDNRWYVELYSEDPDASGGVAQIQFKGWLSQEDLEQEFLPDPNILTLTASDGFGFMSDEPLTDFYGENPSAENRLMDYIVWAFAKTGLKLPLTVCMNIRNRATIPLSSDSLGNGHFYKYNWLNAKTFEAEIGQSEDARAVAEKIFGENACAFQHMGRIFIMRIDEFDPAIPYYLYNFTAEGAFVSKEEQNYSKAIGAGLPLSFMNDDAVVGLIRRYRSVKETFKYETYAEALCNKDFDRGTEITAPDLTQATSTGTYTPECWGFFKRITGGLDRPPEVGAEGIIVKTYEYGYEKDRYISLKTANGFAHYLKSEGVYLQAKDKFTATIDWRQTVNEGGSGQYSRLVMMVRLFADSGAVYDWQFNESVDQNYWEKKVDSVNVWNSFVYITGDLSEDERSFKTGGGTAAALPEAGFVYIHIYNGTNRDFIYTSFNFEVVPLVNGSYQKYTGQYNQFTDASLNQRAIREKQVYISDSPNRNYKGALLELNGETELYNGSVGFFQYHGIVLPGYQVQNYHKGMRIQITSVSNTGEFYITDVVYHIIGDTTEITTRELINTATETARIYTYLYNLASRFYDGARNPDAVFDTEETVGAFGWVQAFDVWNQHNRQMTRFEGTMDGLESNVSYPDLLQKYTVDDVDGTSNGRTFMLLHYRMNAHLCETEVYLVETSLEGAERSYDGHEFKYITQ